MNIYETNNYLIHSFNFVLWPFPCQKVCRNLQSSADPHYKLYAWYVQNNHICVFICIHWHALDSQISKTKVQIDIKILKQSNAAGISYHLQAFENCLNNSLVYLFQCYVFGACNVWNNEIDLHICVPS